jgi:hypothetical protein
LDIRLEIAITIVTMAIVGPTKSLKRDTMQQSTVIKFETIVAMALIHRFALAFLFFVVDYGQKGHCHAVSLMSDD